jgi:hypothetical protein
MKKILITTLLFLGVLIIPNSVLATTFDLIGPSSTPVRGQEVKFTINVDTEGASLSSAVVGMTYETKYLEYVSVVPGNSYTTVLADVQSGGRLVITGSSVGPYAGSGVFAYVTFKLIATGSGETQLCALFNPSSPTSTPPPGATTIPSSPVPTSLPTSGESKPAAQGVIIASLFFVAAGVGLFVLKKT